jgi:hypothetical protein
MIMNTQITAQIKSLGQQVTKQDKAVNNTNDSRYDLVCILQTEHINLNVQETDILMKLECSRLYPKGTGKTACPIQKKQLQAVRVCLSTYKRGYDMSIKPLDFDTFSQFRAACYLEEPLTKIQQIEKWYNSDKVVLTLEELEELVTKLSLLASNA